MFRIVFSWISFKFWFDLKFFYLLGWFTTKNFNFDQIFDDNNDGKQQYICFPFSFEKFLWVFSWIEYIVILNTEYNKICLKNLYSVKRFFSSSNLNCVC